VIFSCEKTFLFESHAKSGVSVETDFISTKTNMPRLGIGFVFASVWLLDVVYYVRARSYMRLG